MIKIFKKIALIALICMSFADARFNLTIISKIAQDIPEYPDKDKGDWKHSDFTSFWQLFKPSVWQRFLRWIGYIQVPWTNEDFSQILQTVLTERQRQGFTGTFVQKLFLGINAKIVVFGDLKGAFHSLIRDLQELRRLDIIDDNLKLKPDAYIVFNGNVIDNSPQNFGTLSVVLYLMEMNADNVFYIRGPNEQNSALQESTYLQQLKIQIGPDGTKLFDKSKALFNTLPVVLYIMYKPGDGVKISAGLDDALDKQVIERFLVDKEEPKTIEVAANGIENEQTLTAVQAIITSPDYSQTIGLKRYVGPPITWTAFSSPTGPHRRLYKFFNDAFVIITTAPQLEQWTIRLYYQDVRKEEGFISPGVYNLVTGALISGRPLNLFDQKQLDQLQQEVVQKEQIAQQLQEQCQVALVDKEKEIEPEIGEIEKKEPSEKVPPISKQLMIANQQPVIAVQDQNIILGCTLDLEKGIKALSQSVVAGIRAGINQIDQEGGINDKKIHIDFENDSYIPSKARHNVEKLLKDKKTDILLGPLGTPTLENYLDLVKEGKLLVLFPFTGSSVFRKPDLINIIHYRASYAMELAILTEYLIEQYGTQKFALFYQSGTFGESAIKGIMKVLEAHNITSYIETPFEPHDVQFTKQIDQIKQFDPDAIAFVGPPIAVQEFIRQIDVKALLDKYLYSISSLGEKGFQNFLQQKGLPFIMANVVPDPITSNIPLAIEFRKIAEKEHFPIDAVSFEAYLVTMLTGYLLKQVQGVITKEKIIEAAQQIKHLNFGGIMLNFEPKTRVLGTSIWIDERKAPWKKIDFQQVKAKYEELKKDHEVIIKPAAELAVKDGIIVVATLLDLSRGLKSEGNEIKKALEFKIDSFDRKEGDRQIKLLVINDQYIPRESLQNVKELLQDGKTDIILSPLGSSTTASYLDLIKKGEALVLFPMTGATIFRKPELTHMLFFRASYEDEGYRLTENMIEQKQIKKFAFLYQNDLFGKSLLNGAKKALKQTGITEYIEVPYTRNEILLKKQADKITEFDPQAIGFFSVGVAAQELIRQINPLNLHDKVLFGSSNLSERRFQEYIKNSGLNFTIASVVPNPETSQLPIVQAFRQDAQKYDIPISTFSLEAYINATLFEELLKRVEGTITKQKIIDAAEQFANINIEGLELSFNPNTRSLSDTIWFISSGKSMQ